MDVEAAAVANFLATRAGFPAMIFFDLYTRGKCISALALPRVTATLLCLLITLSASHAEDVVLFRPAQQSVRAGMHSSFALLVKRIEKQLALCNGRPLISSSRDVDLMLSDATAGSIVSLIKCTPSIPLPPGSAARSGAITYALWQAIMPDHPPPSLHERAEVLTLAFEATDFADPPEWNFCQDGRRGAKDRSAAILAGATCYNATDPCSMLTWGPRGATAGQGRELQWIIWKLYRTEPKLLAAAFGREFSQVERFVRLKGAPSDTCDGTAPLEHFMCAVWISAARRKAWETGLVTLSRSDATRRIYRAVYAGHQFDGYKFAAYFSIWQRIGLEPSELDFAFFFDRATHIGAPPEMEANALNAFSECVRNDTKATTRNAAARRCLSLGHPHPTMPVDRLGRDVAYYRAAYPEQNPSRNETETWQRHIPLDAAFNFGLSDARAVPATAILTQDLPAADRPPEDFANLTVAERTCPARIRNPVRHLPP